ncbi:MAG: hypothetical protein ABFS19_06765 [Thermodesulfobacteriota bacterium]
MQCERLISQIKSWFLHVQNETMAPARMVSFMEKHADECEICQSDPDVLAEIAKITEMVLPESKIPKATRMKQEAAKKAEQENKQEDDTDAADPGDSDDSSTSDDSNDSKDSKD